MDYIKHYNLLIQKAQSRVIAEGTYKELHHIIPRSEGGSDEACNLVYLTAREHFVAHWLLHRADTTNPSRAFSLWRMCNGKSPWVPSSRVYEEARIAHSKAISRALKGKPKTPDHVAKVAASNRGKKRSEEARERMSIAKKGKPLTQQHRNNMKGRVPWNKGYIMPSEVGQKIQAALKGNGNAAKPCSIEGRIYPSAKAASEAEGIPLPTLKNRLRNTNKTDYFYLK
jgi:5-methylcytosine-specific restriction endonuclease McrA